jgi:putative ABC transport system permease protein
LILSIVLTPLFGNLLENLFWFFSPNFTIVPVLVAMPSFMLLGWIVPACVYKKAAKYSVVERLRDI